jgi:hypothetical protein
VQVADPVPQRMVELSHLTPPPAEMAPSRGPEQRVRLPHPASDRAGRPPGAPVEQRPNLGAGLPRNSAGAGPAGAGAQHVVITPGEGRGAVDDGAGEADQHTPDTEKSDHRLRQQQLHQMYSAGPRHWGEPKFGTGAPCYVGEQPTCRTAIYRASVGPAGAGSVRRPGSGQPSAHQSGGWSLDPLRDPSPCARRKGAPSASSVSRGLSTVRRAAAVACGAVLIGLGGCRFGDACAGGPATPSAESVTPAPADDLATHAPSSHPPRSPARPRLFHLATA